MTIQVLGTGCSACKKLFELTKQAVLEMKLEASVEYVVDVERIVAMGVMSTPVLAINDQVIIAGQLPSLEKIKELLFNYEELTPEIKNDCCSCGGKC